MSLVPVRTALDFSAVQLQATIFTPDLEISAATITSKFQPAWESYFDGDPTVLPLPEEAPRDYPRMILHSADANWRCEFAPGRVNLFWEATHDSDSIQLSAFLGRASSLFRQYRETLHTRIDRMAVVATRFAQVASPAVFLIRRYLQERWATEQFNLQNVEFNTHTTFQLADKISVNAWMRSSNAIADLGAERISGLVVQQDINTVASDDVTVDFGEDGVEAFYTGVEGALDNLLALYYPEGGTNG